MCEPIQVSMCRDLGYNSTSMPNLVGNERQSDAEFTLNTFQPLIQYGCSSQLRVFLCAVFVPLCTDKVPVAIGPCRGLCDAVRARCFPVLQGFGFQWPALLNCSKFPAANNHETMCMEGPEERAPPQPPRPVRGPAPGADPCARLWRPELYVRANRSGRCALRCEADALFAQGDKRLAGAWASLWAALCLASSVAAGAALAAGAGGGAGAGAGAYPERALAFLALCYALEAAGWGVLALAGREAVACDGRGPGAMLAHDGLPGANCALVFLLLYYFGTAAHVWWAVLCGAWLCACALRWPPERTQRHSSLFHLAGWGIPAVLTIAVLVLRAVDADELTGACFVGAQDTRSLLLFVLAPHAAILLFGTTVLASGFAALLRPAPPPPQPPSSPDLQRLGVFAALCAVPAACVVASLAYEYAWRPAWLAKSAPGVPQPRPPLWVFLLRIFMSLVVGVTSVLWAWSPKTLRAWRRLFRRLAGGPYKQAPPKGDFPVHCYTPAPAPAPSPAAQPPLRCSSAHKHRNSKHRSAHGNETAV